MDLVPLIDSHPQDMSTELLEIGPVRDTRYIHPQDISNFFYTHTHLIDLVPVTDSHS